MIEGWLILSEMSLVASRASTSDPAPSKGENKDVYARPGSSGSTGLKNKSSKDSGRLRLWSKTR
jgi:hypothetical protein